MPDDLDPPAKASWAKLVTYGVVVTIGSDPDGRIVAGARDGAGETWQVWAAAAYDALEVAQQVAFALDG